MNNKKRVKIILFLFCVAAAVFIYFGNNVIKVTHYNIKSDKLPDAFNGYKIVHLSDLHSKSFGEQNVDILHKIDDEDPDIVVMTGDMIDSHFSDYSAFLSLSKELVKKYSVYYIIGNHELDLSPSYLNKAVGEITKAGVVFLDGKAAPLEKDSGFINIYGINLGNEGYSNKKDQFNKKRIDTIFGEPDASCYNILIVHNPAFFEVYANWGADLTLCGHTHGGMIRLPLVGGVLSPQRELFPKYDYGLFEEGDKKMIISGGLGNGFLKFRIFNDPEIVVITLEK